MMGKWMTYGILSLAVLGLTSAWGDDSSKALTDEAFVLKASEGGLAEVNLGNLAAKTASDSGVREFARMMVKDHTKANSELLALANRKSFKVARTMDTDHQKDFDKLTKLSGADFDSKYMEGQIKGHELMVAIFQKESKNGKDEEVKQWAEKTLPTVKMHLQMAKESHKKLKGSSR